MAAVVTGVVAAVVWAFLAYAFLRLKRRFSFNHLSGLYSVELKVEGIPQPWRVAMRRCRFPSNRFEVEYLRDDGSIEATGQITMNDALPMCGEGAYTQEVPGSDLWGLWRVTAHRDRRKVFVDREYAGTYGDRPKGWVLAAYVWTQEEAVSDLPSRLWRRIAPR